MYTTKNDQGEVQSSIAIKGNTISIESDNFTLSKKGDITATSGKIGGKKSKKNNTKAVTIHGVQYESKKDAMEKLGIGRKKLDKLIKNLVTICKSSSYS